jgi:hypothetical protein
MKHSTDSKDDSVPSPTPVEVFYVIRTTAARGERNHCLCSSLYETRPQAQSELARLQQEDTAGDYSVWKSETYIEPAEWLHRVVRSDGTLIMPRLRGTSRNVDA